MELQKCIFNNNYNLSKSLALQRLFNGLKDDSELLFREFESSNDLSFKSFAKVWRQNQFASIFLRAKHSLVTLEYIEGIIHYSKGFLLSEDFTSQIFGVYLIYSIYYKQPFRNKYAKLRLTKNEFESFLSILKTFHEKKYVEPLFICGKIYENGGIEFVATSLETGLELGVRKYFAPTVDDPPTASSLNVINTPTLKTLDHLLKIYKDKKSEVFKDDEVFFADTKFISEVEDIVNDMSRLGEGIEDKELNESSEDIGNTRRKLKKTAYKNGSSTCDNNTEPSPKKVSSSSGNQVKTKTKKRNKDEVSEESLSEVDDAGLFGDSTEDEDVDDPLPVLD